MFCIFLYAKEKVYSDGSHYIDTGAYAVFQKRFRSEVYVKFNLCRKRRSLIARRIRMTRVKKICVQLPLNYMQLSKKGKKFRK